MRTNRTDHSAHSDPIRQHLSLASALGVGLAACLSGPARAEIIDDFEQGYRFWANHGGGDSRIEIIDGQLHFNAAADWGRVTAGYFRNHALPEGEPLTFAVDVISLSPTSWRVALETPFSGGPEGASPGGYGVYRMVRSLRLAKWGFRADGSLVGSWLAEAPMSTVGEAETISLSLARQGDSLQLAGKAVRRATGELLASVLFLDTPGVDPTLAIADADVGAPFLTQTIDVICSNTGTEEGTGSAVIDNLVCSHPPTPQHLTIDRSAGGEMAVVWEGEGLLVESATPQGPWTPCIAEVSNSASRFTGRVPPLDSHRFFALAKGWNTVDRFGIGSWHAAKAEVGAPGGKLVLQVSGGMASAYGGTLGNQDFLIRRGVTGVWWRDCVASVDISYWRPEMQEGAAYGIVLRAKPRSGLWLIEEEGLPESRYIGLLTFKKPGRAEESVLSITGPGGELLQETTIPAVDGQQDYRLRFWALRDELKLELLDLNDLSRSIGTCNATDDRCPTGIEALFVKASPEGVTRVDFDNFLFWGVFTPAEW